MRRLTDTEREVVCTLITDIEDGIAKIGRVLGADSPEVQEIRGVRDWLRGIRDTGMIVFDGSPRQLGQVPPDHPDASKPVGWGEHPRDCDCGDCP